MKELKITLVSSFPRGLPGAEVTETPADLETAQSYTALFAHVRSGIQAS